MIIKVLVASYKKAQVFRKDYVRKNGEFLKFERASGNHRYCIVELNSGEEFDARGSQYQNGATKWTSANCQGWARFKFDGERLTAHKFDGGEIPLPHWVRQVGQEQVLEGDECKSFEA
jgi:hypothetical protein